MLLRNIHALFEAKMAQKAHGYCVWSKPWNTFERCPASFAIVSHLQGYVN
jgi:hypothetical protein